MYAFGLQVKTTEPMGEQAWEWLDACVAENNAMYVIGAKNLQETRSLA